MLSLIPDSKVVIPVCTFVAPSDNWVNAWIIPIVSWVVPWRSNVVFTSFKPSYKPFIIAFSYPESVWDDSASCLDDFAKELTYAFTVASCCSLLADCVFAVVFVSAAFCAFVYVSSTLFSTSDAALSTSSISANNAFLSSSLNLSSTDEFFNLLTLLFKSDTLDFAFAALLAAFLAVSLFAVCVDVSDAVDPAESIWFNSFNFVLNASNCVSKLLRLLIIPSFFASFSFNWVPSPLDVSFVWPNRFLRPADNVPVPSFKSLLPLDNFSTPAFNALLFAASCLLPACAVLTPFVYWEIPNFKDLEPLDNWVAPVCRAATPFFNVFVPDFKDFAPLSTLATPAVYVFSPTESDFAPFWNVNVLDANFFKFCSIVSFPAFSFFAPLSIFLDPSAAFWKPLPAVLIWSNTVFT